MESEHPDLLGIDSQTRYSIGNMGEFTHLGFVSFASAIRT